MKNNLLIKKFKRRPAADSVTLDCKLDRLSVDRENSLQLWNSLAYQKDEEKFYMTCFWEWNLNEELEKPNFWKKLCKFVRSNERTIVTKTAQTSLALAQ